jgi:hypothetical protein
VYFFINKILSLLEITLTDINCFILSIHNSLNLLFNKSSFLFFIKNVNINSLIFSSFVFVNNVFLSLVDNGDFLITSTSFILNVKILLLVSSSLLLFSLLLFSLLLLLSNEFKKDWFIFNGILSMIPELIFHLISLYFMH